MFFAAPATATEFGKADPQQSDMLQNLYAYAAYKSGDYQKAHDLWLPQAQAGNPTAMINLANLYAQGQGVDVDIDAARTWLLKAQALGDGRADGALRELPHHP